MSINPINQFEELTTETLEQEETKERFKISDLSSLAWTFRRIKAEQEKRAELVAYANSEIKRIQEWLQKETKAIDQKINFFNALITEYAQDQKANNPAFKKQTTPYGGIVFKKQKQNWEWQNDEEVAKQFLPEDKLTELNKLVAKLQEEAEGMIRLKITLEPEKDAIKKFTLIPVKTEVPCPSCGGQGEICIDANYLNEVAPCQNCGGEKSITVEVEGEYRVLSPDGVVLPGIVVKEQGEKLDIKIG